MKREKRVFAASRNAIEIFARNNKAQAERALKAVQVVNNRKISGIRRQIGACQRQIAQGMTMPANRLFISQLQGQITRIQRNNG